MGQSVSSQEPEPTQESDPQLGNGTTEEIEQEYNDRVLRQFNASELYTFKCRVGMTRQLNDVVLEQELLEWLCLPLEGHLQQPSKLLVGVIKVLGQFPFISNTGGNLTAVSLLKAVILINRGKCLKYIGNKSYNHLELIFMALYLAQDSHDSTKKESYDPKEPHNIEKVISSYDGNSDCVSEITVQADNLLQFTTMLLLLSARIPRPNSQIDLKTADNDWAKYEKSAYNVIRTMNSSIISSCQTHTISFHQFYDVISILLPTILTTLDNLLQHLLYTPDQLVDHTALGPTFTETKVMNHGSFALLQFALADKGYPISKLQKLYVGRDSGFSMRSFQGKVFHWHAPTLLFVSGSRIQDDDDYSKNKNPRYSKFLEDFRKLRDTDQQLSPCLLKKRKVMFVIYIESPWRVTNKDYFSAGRTTIFQLSPELDIFKANRDDVVYFNTMGGGIGIGDTQPYTKVNYREYRPGNISLTLDSSLEFGAFRNVGPGGMFEPGALFTRRNGDGVVTSNSYELRFLIQDVEVWGCGGEKELSEQMKQLQWEETEAKRRQHVNLKSLSEDRALLEMAGLVGQHQSGGSI
ncbi:Rtc5p KNAG_0B04230 [Huiozyma naganishii CBS 8797]|uniref:TLDc domain-containing protein n=1 Tax=Huiozyma naganishii (strain ATCC MYA-139 / BCRC 22969 / CBS 8797 / KCTC 17520 / NBRC 10181 / NCYC 3082 / Yp74L-3) TaxID=1071383 RepID=J7RH41_HUIN7|nr:hypothetical protein KNAG_0B04230 [Kazachstania naganishii CBS 8797]CCK68858.1 hypothetical protein KNAG_0B04230 [Kazachstania naganishii CBS 8797]